MNIDESILSAIPKIEFREGCSCDLFSLWTFSKYVTTSSEYKQGQIKSSISFSFSYLKIKCLSYIFRNNVSNMGIPKGNSLLYWQQSLMINFV